MEIKGYKAFNPGLVCNGKQYAENTTFEEPKAELCKCGMHFCQNPMDVLEYYPLINDNGEFTEFAEVVADGETKTNGNKGIHNRNDRNQTAIYVRLGERSNGAGKPDV